MTKLSVLTDAWFFSPSGMDLDNAVENDQQFRIAATIKNWNGLPVKANSRCPDPIPVPDLNIRFAAGDRGFAGST